MVLEGKFPPEDKLLGLGRVKIWVREDNELLTEETFMRISHKIENLKVLAGDIK